MKLEAIEAKAFIRGIEPDVVVRIVEVEPAGPDAIKVAYRRPQGPILETMLFRSDEDKLSPSSTSSLFTFAAKADHFKLAAEATRIKLAHLFDPMMAIHTSNVDPLPHQIAAVYESMLPKQPLRFVLADDPGAGKTIMAGLLIRELMLRGDLQRCLIVSPGSLVEQWQTELLDKFGLRFDILTYSLVESTATGNPFVEHNLLIARLDQLSRKEDWQAKLVADGAQWDLVIIDEAHKLSAHYGSKNELVTTRRYELGKLVGHPDRTRNFLMMTATPHNGHEEDFQAWLNLIDEDRFLGKASEGTKADVSDIMRRMVKEDLITFDNKPLFPDRIAETAMYTLAPAEKALYDDVTAYVREQMGKAQQMLEKKKGAIVGFALQILQRRLCSSPWAIAESLRRRREKLEAQLKLLKQPKTDKPAAPSWESAFEYSLDDADDSLSAEELEEAEELAVDQATAARTIPELDKEIEHLKLLEKQAHEVLKNNIDKKWEQLSSILQSDDPVMLRSDGTRRKMIIFTEHRDTLNYLRDKIAKKVFGNEKRVVEIHGGTRREDRMLAQDRFRQDPDVAVLVATDAAGEGVNLQVANLMVNYDLPWNPNRIEQRFGRIHRIGQKEVCRLWNLVAKDTREGEVFERLFFKIEEQKAALGGKVFDILGHSFEEKPLKQLLLEAIQHGDDPEVRAKLFKVVDSALDTKHLEGLYKRNALTQDAFNTERLAAVKDQMDRAEAKKLQPFYLRRFLDEALQRAGGALRERESERYEVKHVPAVVRQFNKVHGSRRQVLEKYERITFDRARTREPLGKPVADLVHPAHPLMAALIDHTLKEHESSLIAGTTLIDPLDPDLEPRLLLLVDHGIREGTDPTRLASRRTHFIEINASGVAKNAGAAPYLNYAAPTDGEAPLIAKVLAEPWLKQDLGQLALAWATQHLVKEHVDEVTTARERMVKKTLQAVHERLTKAINQQSKRVIELTAKVKSGDQMPVQLDNAQKRLDELKSRLQHRTEELEAMRHVASNPPIVTGCAVVLPQGLVDQFHFAQGEQPAPPADSWFTLDPAVRKQVEMAAMKAVTEAEEALGQTVKDESALKVGWDLKSHGPLGDRFLEVKGRRHDADTVTVTVNEVLEGKNKGKDFFLCIVLVDGQTVHAPRYVREPFLKEPDAGVTSINYTLKDLLKRAKDPKSA